MARPPDSISFVEQPPAGEPASYRFGQRLYSVLYSTLDHAHDIALS